MISAQTPMKLSPTSIASLLCVSLFGAGVFLLAKPAIAAETDSIFGINVGMELRYERSEEATVIQKLQDLKVSWVREEFNWNVIEPQQGLYDWNGYDLIMEQYAQADIKVLGVLVYSADWASTAPVSSTEKDKYPPTVTAWRDFVDAVVRRYPAVTAWEVWNEPNHEHFLHARDRASAYAAILKTASAAIRAASPHAQVVLGGLSGADAAFLQKLYRLGLKDAFDVVAVHPYRTLNGRTIYAPELTVFGLNSLATDLHVLRSMIRAYDPESPPPIWITEIGWSSDATGVSASDQANFLQRSAIIARFYAQVEKIFWYNLRDDVATDEAEKHFGLFTNDWEEKPAAHALGQLTRSYPTATVTEDAEPFNTVLADVLNPRRMTVEYYTRGKRVHATESGVATTTVRAKRSTAGASVRYRFSNNAVPEFRRIILRDIPSFARGSVNLWLWSDGGIHPVRFRLRDAKGEMFQGDAGYTGYGWTLLSLSLSADSAPIISWGKNADGKVDYPVRFDSIIVEKNVDSPKRSGELVLSRLTTKRVDDAYGFRLQQDGRNIWVYWTTGTAKVVQTRAPLGRLLETRRYSDMAVLMIPPREKKSMNVFSFGLEQKPLFVR